MIRLAETLASDLPHVRVRSFYNNIAGGNPFGDFFTPGRFQPLSPDEKQPDRLDCELGELFVLPKAEFVTAECSGVGSVI